MAAGDETRVREHARAMEILGIEHHECLGLRRTGGRGHVRAWSARSTTWPSRTKPDEVYLPFPSLHQDHIAVYEAGMRSGRLSMSPDHWVPNACSSTTSPSTT